MASGMSAAVMRNAQPAMTTPGPDSQTRRISAGMLRSAAARSRQPCQKRGVTSLMCVVPALRQRLAKLQEHGQWQLDSRKEGGPLSEWPIRDGRRRRPLRRAVRLPGRFRPDGCVRAPVVARASVGTNELAKAQRHSRGNTYRRYVIDTRQVESGAADLDRSRRRGAPLSAPRSPARACRRPAGGRWSRGVRAPRRRGTPGRQPSRCCARVT